MGCSTNDYKQSYNHKDIMEGCIDYKQLIVSKALDVIAKEKKIARNEIYHELLNHYGYGSIESIIIDYFTNQIAK